MVERETRWIFGTGDPWSFELSGRKSLEEERMGNLLRNTLDYYRFDMFLGRKLL